MKLYHYLTSMILLFSACFYHPVTRPQDALESLSWPGIYSLEDDLGFKGLSEAVRQSMKYYRSLAPDMTFYFGDKTVTALDLLDTLQEFLQIIEDSSLTYRQKIRVIEKKFIFYRAVGSNGRGRVLFTGYYEPVISCRTRADDTYRFPLYRRPKDIIEVDLLQFGDGFPVNRIFGRVVNNRLIPYYSREDINHKNALKDKGLEILWCSDPVDIYFLQIQGSGKADLGDGNIVSVLYDGQNGRPYRSIGRFLIDIGAITKDGMSMQTIRDYLRNNPDKQFSTLNQNPSYVFFRIGDGPSLGSIGAPLTPGRSIASDARLFPKGALALIRTEKPMIENGSVKGWLPFTRFVLNQDSGVAIRGPGRVDLFWGRGPEAEIAAGHMQHEGNLFFILKR